MKKTLMGLAFALAACMGAATAQPVDPGGGDMRLAVAVQSVDTHAVASTAAPVTQSGAYAFQTFGPAMDRDTLVAKFKKAGKKAKRTAELNTAHPADIPGRRLLT